MENEPVALDLNVVIRIPHDDTTGLAELYWEPNYETAQKIWRTLRMRGCAVYLYRHVEVPATWGAAQIDAQLDWAVWIEGRDTLGQPYLTYAAAVL